MRRYGMREPGAGRQEGGGICENKGICLTRGGVWQLTGWMRARACSGTVPYPVVLLGALSIVKAVQGTHQVAGDAADAGEGL